MNIKNWLTAAAFTILPSSAGATLPEANVDLSIKKEIPTSHKPTSLTDSVKPEESNIEKDELYEKRIQLLRESKKDMLLLIAHFEDVKTKAYWDNVAKIYSVGFGFTRDLNGNPVTAQTVIRTEEELMQYWERFTEEKMFPTMATFLEIEKTDHQERTVLGCTAFNCGAGIYGDMRKNIPSNYTKTLNAFLATNDSVYLNKAMYQLSRHCTSRGVPVDALKKRRRVEADIFSHKIILVNRDTLKQTNDSTYMLNDTTELPDNWLDLNKTIIGATYSIGKLPSDSTELATKLREYDKYGYNYQDSLDRAFALPLVVRPIRRKTKTTAPKNPPKNTNNGKTGGR